MGRTRLKPQPRRKYRWLGLDIEAIQLAAISEMPSDKFMERVDHLLAVGDAATRRDEGWEEQYEEYRRQ